MINVVFVYITLFILSCLIFIPQCSHNSLSGLKSDYLKIELEITNQPDESPAQLCLHLLCENKETALGYDKRNIYNIGDVIARTWQLLLS